MKNIILLISLLIGVSAFCQNNAEQTEINNYLERTIKYNNKIKGLGLCAAQDDENPNVSTRNRLRR